MAAMLCETAQSFEDPVELWSAYDRDFEHRFGTKWSNIKFEDRLTFLDSQIRRRDVSEHDKYLLQRRFVVELRFAGERSRIKEVCQSLQVRDDDYETQVACILSTHESLDAQRSALEDLFSKVKLEKKGTTVPAVVADKLLDVLWKQNDIAAAQAVYKAALETTPRQAVISLISLKESAALIFANPSNSRKVIQEALRLYVELEGLYSTDPSAFTDRDRVIYNRAILKTLAFDDYAGALEDFNKLSSKSRNWTDSRVFSAFALINLGEKARALDILGNVDLESYTDTQRRIILECYKEITLFELQKGPEPSSCANFPPETQSDVLFHVTRYLQRKTLSSHFENHIWRQFWTLYTERLSPQMQSQIDQYVSAIELQQAKLDSEVKSLELRNFQLIKSLFVASLVGVLVIGLLLVRLRARNLKIEKLQAYVHKSVLSRFLPPMMVDEIIQGKSRLESDPHEQAVTVLFADMVGFTEISGQLGAQSTAYILNHFMQKISEVIYENAGTIDKFIGDAVMVIFGAPYQVPPEEQARRSLICAKAMLHAIEELNKDFFAKFRVTLSMRVGINHGQAIVGTFGGLKRSDYTAIGPTVNIASRIEGKADPGQILIGPELARLVPAEWLEESIPTQLRGVSGNLCLFPVKVAAIGDTSAGSSHAALLSFSEK